MRILDKLHYIYATPAEQSKKNSSGKITIKTKKTWLRVHADLNQQQTEANSRMEMTFEKLNIMKIAYC